MSRVLNKADSWVVERVCEPCGRTFLTTKYDIARGWGQFCSRGCKAMVRNAAGATSPRWKGGRSVRPDGYVHAATGKAGGKAEHLVIAERALGHALPEDAEVHHFNGRKDDNRNQNLVICQDAGYHKFLHVLQRVRALGGRPFLDRICSICRQPKPIDQFSPRERRCKVCNAARVAAANERAVA